MVVESRHDNGENRAQTPAPANERYPFLNCKIWEDTVEAIPVDDAYENENENENENEEWLEDEKVGEPEMLPDRKKIVLDYVSIDT